MIGNVFEVLNFNQLFLLLNRFMCNFNTYDIWCHLSYGIAQCYIYLLYISYFTNKCEIVEFKT